MKTIWICSIYFIIAVHSISPDWEHSGDQAYVTDDEEFVTSGDYLDARELDLLEDAATTASTTVTTYGTELDDLYEDDMIYDEIDNIEEDGKNRELNSDDEDFDEERLPAIETEIIRDEDQILKELDSNNKNLDRDEEKITELERKVEDLKNQRSEIVNTPKYVETFKEEIIVTPDEIIVEEEYIDQDNSQIDETILVTETIKDDITVTEAEEDQSTINTIILACVLLGAILFIAVFGLLIHRIKKKDEGSYRIAGSPSSTQALLTKNEEAYA